MVIYTLVIGDRVRDGGLVEWRRHREEILSTQEAGRETVRVAMEYMKTK